MSLIIFIAANRPRKLSRNGRKLFGLGLMQGITEFINFGTLLALVIYYRKRIWQILKDVFVKHDLGLATNIVITCIPAVILGVLLNDLIQF